MTGMRGVCLVAAELSRLGFIVSPTSRSAAGADLLVTNHSCLRAFSVQVKTNATSFGFWLVGKHALDLKARSHIYVLLNLKQKRGKEEHEFFVVPSATVARLTREYPRPHSTWFAVDRASILRYRDRWAVFGSPAQPRHAPTQKAGGVRCLNPQAGKRGRVEGGFPDAGPMDFEIIGKITAIESIASGRGVRDRGRLERFYGKGRWRKLREFNRTIDAGQEAKKEILVNESH
jgi:hypothetical protein